MDVGDACELLALLLRLKWTSHSHLLKCPIGKLAYVMGSKLPLFSYGRDGHQPYSRALYTHYKDSLLKVG